MTIVTDITILIVGPDNIFRRSMANMLTTIGFSNIHEVHDGTTAWEVLRRIQPRIVITQWDMPEMNGMALLKLIRRDNEYGDTPLILWTKEIDKTDVVKAGETGVNSIIVDPVGLESLESKMHAILDFEMSPQTKQAKNIMARGDFYLKENRLEEALREYEHVLDILESAEVYYNIGYIKTAKGEYDEALAAFRKATQLNQMFAKAYKAMADVYLRMDNKQMAEQYLQMAGEIFLEREMHESAESIFNEILAINPDTINVYNSLGIIYRRQHRFQDALIQYQKAVKISPTDENIYFNMGRVYLELNNPDMAKKCFIKAVKINPNFDIAQGMLTAIQTSEKVD